MKIIKKLSAILLSACIIASLSGTKVSAAGGIEKLLNTAPLFPVQTASPQTNVLVEAVLSQITNDKMTTYQKVLACYDYLIASCSYERRMIIIDSNCNGFASLIDLEAHDMLLGHKGSCDDYTAAFVALTRAIGVNSYVAGGFTTKASGGYTPHAWAVIILDGQEYIFDAQIDDKLSSATKISHARFGKTYAELPGKYIPNGTYDSISFAMSY